MCGSNSLRWRGIVTNDFRKWVLKSNDTQAIYHRTLHREILIDINAGIFYSERQKESQVLMGTDFSIPRPYIKINGNMADKIDFDLSSRVYMERILPPTWLILEDYVPNLGVYKSKGFTGSIRDLYQIMNVIRSAPVRIPA